MSNAELATGYAALILADEGLEITADKLATLTKAAGIEVESIWTQLFAKALEGKDVKDLLLNVGGTCPRHTLSTTLYLLQILTTRLWCRCTCCCRWCCRRWRRRCCRGDQGGGEGGGEGGIR